MKTKLNSIVLIAALLLGVGNVWATQVEVDYGTLYYYTLDETPSNSIPTTQFLLSIDGTQTYGFCVDPFTTIDKSTYSYQFLGWTEEYYKAAWLMDTYAPNITTISGRASTVGIQSSIWSAVTNLNYAPEYNTEGQKTTYNSWFGSIPVSFDSNILSKLESEYKILLPYLHGQDLNIKQALIVKYPSVPVPGAALLLGSALIGMVGIRKKFMV
jgi:hypothetical protein